MSASDSSSKLEAVRHHHVSRVRVRYGETDAMGWVYYANYLYYFEVGRSDLIRSLWKSYREMEEDGVILPVVESHCRYIEGARYDDELEIHSTLTVPGSARIRFDYEIRRADSEALIVQGYTLHCFVNRTARPIRMPAELLKALTK